MIEHDDSKQSNHRSSTAAAGYFSVSTGGIQSKQDQVFSPNKISGVGTNFELLVHVLPGPNKQRGRQPSILLS